MLVGTGTRVRKLANKVMRAALALAGAFVLFVAYLVYYVTDRECGNGGECGLEAVPWGFVVVGVALIALSVVGTRRK
jgi:DMSO/TMAO reductase YedYZ heme-binding membrane subunit